MTFETTDIFIVNDRSFERKFLDLISSYSNINIVGVADNIEAALVDLRSLLERKITIDLIVLFCRDRASFIAGKSEFKSYQRLIEIVPDLPIFILSGSNCNEQFINILEGLKNENKNDNFKSYDRSVLRKARRRKLPNFLANNARSGLQEIKYNLDRVNKKIAKIQAKSQTTDKFFQKNSKVFFDLLFWQGRRRELLLAKSLVQKFTPDSPGSIQHKIIDSEKNLIAKSKNNNPESYELTERQNIASEISMENEGRENTDLAPIFSENKTARTAFNCQLFKRIFYEIELEISNSTGLLLEIDIFKKSQTIELFKIILKKLDRIYQAKITEQQKTESQNELEEKIEPKNKNVQILKNQQEINLFQKIFNSKTQEYDKNQEKIAQNNELVPLQNKYFPLASSPENGNILLEVWKQSTKDFLNKCLEESSEIYDIESIVEEEFININAEILNKIPLFDEAFTWLTNSEKKSEFILAKKTQKEIDPLEEISGEKAVKIVIQNSIVKIANATIVVILNNFIRVESVEKKLYKPNLISSREMARVRNNLSWRYRKEKYFEEPKNIFESQYRLFYINDNKIYVGWFYNPRYEELNQLKGIPWLTTIAIETRDALAPILQAIVGFLGEALFYFLKDVIGRGIGLIGQGIIQGVGNALQDNRYSKNNKRAK